MRRPYFFEIFIAANLAALLLFARESLPIVGSPLRLIVTFSLSFATQALAGIAVRSVIALIRRDRAYFRIIRSRDWILDTIRLIVAGGALVTVYGWIKLVVPIYHPRLFDQQLWDLDQRLFFGLSPTVLFLDLFNKGPVLRAIDLSYAYIFFASAFVGFAYFFSEPSRRVRMAFANGNAMLWIAGAWLYMLVPSIGPAYRFPDVWLAHGESLRVTQVMQRLLMQNYQNVLRAAQGLPVSTPIRIAFGVAAFPSLHVAFQTYAFLWMRRLWTSGEVLFGIFVFTIFLGSMVTGWHYFIDGLGGMVLAYVCYRVSWDRARGDETTEARRGGGDTEEP